MGTTSKRQMLTAAASLSLFMLGSASVATAGLVFPDPPGLIKEITQLEGTLKKAKEVCGKWGQQAFGDEFGEQDKPKDNYTLTIDWFQFPDLDGRLVGDGHFFFVDGYGIRTKGNKGTFTLVGFSEIGDPFGDPITGGQEKEIFLNGTFTTNDQGVPVKLKGKWSSASHLFVPEPILDPFVSTRPLDTICVTTIGKFTLNGDGNKILLFPIDPD